MTRRGLTLLLATFLAVGLAVGGAFVRVPYVSLKPGPAINTLGSVGGTPVLSITGATVHDTDGALDLTTVSVEDRINLFQALAGWVSSNDAVLPREVVFPPDQSTAQTNAQNTQEMQDSQDSATTAALTQLGYKATATNEIRSVIDKSPADGKLKPADTVTSIDGTAVSNGDQLRALVSSRKPGDSVTVGYTRDGTPGSAVIKTVASQDDARRAVVGIGLLAVFPVKVNIVLKDVGGPSAGLMFALGIVDKLGPSSITGGKIIAGTGEITDDGTVQPIGGIAQKMRGAKARGATVFLSPAENCAEAAKTKPSGITLIKVSSLKTALAALATLRSGGTPPSC